MTGSKYGKYILREPLVEGIFKEITSPVLKLEGGNDCDGSPCSMSFHFIHKPFMMLKSPQVNNYDMFMVFAGADPTDMKEFHAVAELSLGEEGETQVINATAAIYIPKGMVYGPLEFKRIDKPIIFVNLSLTPSASPA